MRHAYFGVGKTLSKLLRVPISARCWRKWSLPEKGSHEVGRNTVADLTRDSKLAHPRRVYRGGRACFSCLRREGSAVPPAVLSMYTAGGGFHVKAGLLELDRSYFAAKVNGNFPENSSRFGLPTIQGVIVLCDAGNGTPLAVMDSRDITSLRTAAATAVAAKFLAREDSRTATICGCGNQGRIQLKALSRVRHIQNVFAYDKDREKALRLARECASDPKISVTPTEDLSAAVRQSDVCVTCTPSRQPLL